MPCQCSGHTKECLASARDKQKYCADKKRREVSYSVGDEVLLSTKHLKLQNPDGAHKLLPCWIGPFPITAVLGKAAVKLDLSQIQLTIHNVFHVSLVKSFKSDGTWHPPKPLQGFEGEDAYKADTESRQPTF